MSFYNLFPDTSTVRGLAYESYYREEAVTPLHVLNAQQQASRAQEGLRYLYSLVSMCEAVDPGEVDRTCERAGAAVYAGSLIAQGESELAARQVAQTGIAPALFC